MESPTAPLDEFYEIAPDRESCYAFKYDSDGRVLISSPSNYPSNANGYYQVDDNYKYQCPMFLMKCFVAVAAEDSGFSGTDFATLNVAPYLESAKEEFIDQITDIYVIRRMERLTYPHCPESYCILTPHLEASNFK